MVYKLIIAYEGTEYHGWQVQANRVSVQAKVEEALTIILQEPVRITGSGRTDAGVHALGQVAHFYTGVKVDMSRILFSLNSLLPKDIRIIEIDFLHETFHAQHHARSKVYRYHLYLDKVLNPFKRAFVWHIPFKFDQDRLNEAAKYFIGTHDFTSFSNEAHKGIVSRNPVRTIHRIDITPEEGGVAIEFEGNGFLYKMVRNIVGTLVDCAIGKRDPAEIPHILEAKNRRAGCMAAPPQGLFLVRVHY